MGNLLALPSNSKSRNLLLWVQSGCYGYKHVCGTIITMLSGYSKMTMSSSKRQFMAPHAVKLEFSASVLLVIECLDIKNYTR